MKETKEIVADAGYLASLIRIFASPGTTKALFQAAVVLGSAFVIGAKEQGPFCMSRKWLPIRKSLSTRKKRKLSS